MKYISYTGWSDEEEGDGPWQCDMSYCRPTCPWLYTTKENIGGLYRKIQVPRKCWENNKYNNRNNFILIGTFNQKNSIKTFIKIYID